MQWKEFEHLVAEVFERQGFDVSCSLDGGPDGGVDVVLKKDGRITLVQCKCWRSWSVGVPTVREMFGILHHEGAAEAIIVTTGDFTEAAHSFAKGKPLKLINGPALWELVSAVKVATDLRSETIAAQVPTCPKCGGGMLKRAARKGPSPGKLFLGCSRFPACNGTRSLT